MIRVPDHPGSLDAADPVLYAALDNPGTGTYRYTSNGTLPPTGTLIGQPSYLRDDQNGCHGQDAFGIWRFPLLTSLHGTGITSWS